MMKELYALGNDRSARMVCEFLDHFLPNRESCCVDYPVPESADEPALVLKTEREILDYLERHPREPYGLYWNDAGPSSMQVMVFYTRDGKAIFGIAEDTAAPDKRWMELAKFVGADCLMLGSEERPPDTSEAFIALAQGNPDSE